jgi:hypothetical protein
MKDEEKEKDAKKWKDEAEEGEEEYKVKKK